VILVDNENKQNSNNRQYDDPFSQLMFTGEYQPPASQNNQSNNQTPQSQLQQQLQNVDIEALANNFNNVMKLANELGPVMKQISPLLALFKKK
jgi:hypothetical protein